jgi:DNA-binding IclR family transcriptional regulator
VKEQKTPRYSVPALDKGLDILEALSQSRVPLSITDLAAQLKRTRNEIFRMLDGLEQRAYILRDPASGKYSLTLRLYELAHTHSPVDQLLKAASGPMQRLSDAIRESCHLSVLNRGMLVVIAATESPEPVRLSVEVGYRVSPLLAVSGSLLVSFLDQSDQQHFLQNDPFYMAMSNKRRAALKTGLLSMREQQCYMTRSTRRAGVDCAALVGNPKIGVIAALGVPFISGGTNEGKEEKLIPTIRQAAQEITSALGLTLANIGQVHS